MCIQYSLRGGSGGGPRRLYQLRVHQFSKCCISGFINQKPEPACTAHKQCDRLVQCTCWARSSKDDPVGIPPIIHQQTLYDSVVLTEHSGVIRGLPTDSDQRNFVLISDCSKVLTCIIYNI